MTKSLFVALLLWPIWASASTVLALPDLDLAAQADLIAYGSILSTRTVTTERGQVVTRAEVQLLRVVKAKGGERDLSVVTVQVPGGRRDDGLIAVTPGAPVPKQGEQAVLILEHRAGTYRPLGLSFGWLSVRDDGAGPKVFRPLEDLNLVGPGGAAVRPGSFRIDGEPLERVLARFAPGSTP